VARIADIYEHVFVTTAGIMHADLDSFFASVEQRDQPRLRGRPVIVGGGVVLAASYEAKRFGVQSGMGAAVWRRLCPHAIVVPPRFEAYSTASDEVFDIFRRTTPIVEGLSIDEAFLDVRGLLRVSGTPLNIATTLRRQVRDEVGLAITVGIARTKFLAKVASGVAKPDGLLLVEPDRELAFLHPLPIERLWGVGRITAAKMHDRGIFTVGEVASLEERALVSMLGKGTGRHLFALAHNRDPRPVQTGRRRRSIGSQRALGRGRHTVDDLEATLLGIVDRVARRLRAGQRQCRTVVLRLRFDDFSRATRSHTLWRPTDSTELLSVTARALLAAAMPMIWDGGVTLIGLSLSNLDSSDAVQLQLPFTAADPVQLDVAVDAIRERYGSAAVVRGVLLGRDPGYSMPMLPDLP
jgi:DNA polymerase-4